jgi:urocanate hydratase
MRADAGFGMMLCGERMLKYNLDHKVKRRCRVLVVIGGRQGLQSALGRYEKSVSG